MNDFKAPDGAPGMPKVATQGTTGGHEVEDAAEGENFKPLTREEAQRLRQQNPSLSVWWVVGGQLLAGLLVAGLTAVLSGKASLAWSVLYGSLAVVIPGALFARGLTSKLASVNPGAAVAGFFLWELVKIASTIAMLFAAPKLVENLSWPAMLAGLVVTMKVVWLVLWFKPKHPPGQ